jgi:hypothetical protein
LLSIKKEDLVRQSVYIFVTAYRYCRLFTWLKSCLFCICGGKLYHHRIFKNSWDL